MAGENRGSIAFFTTYRPAVPLDIYSSPLRPTSKQDELPMTDGESYNYNGQIIPSAALKTILRHTILGSHGREADVNSGRLSGMLFVSERGSLETLHVALRLDDNTPKVFSLADVFGTAEFNGVRMEDSGCIAGDYLVYITTKDPAIVRRQPWTAVYRTNLKTGETDRLTPRDQADLSPSVSPSGKKIAVASFEENQGWHGEIEELKTNIFVMDVENPLERRVVVRNGGWPTWGSDEVIFFHRKVGKNWGIYRADISNGGVISDAPRVTPEGMDAITPVAINATTVVAVTIRQESNFKDVRVEAQYRHIEIFDSTRRQSTIQITQKITPEADHFNPFVIDGGKRIGYHRCNTNRPTSGSNIDREFHKLSSPQPDVGLFRVSGVFPTFSKDGSKLAFVDNEFKNVWVADNEGLRIVFPTQGPDNIFSPVWNQNSEKDTLYVCMGPSFNPDGVVEICAIFNASSGKQIRRQLTKGGFNNAFPSSSPDGKKLVFRSTNTRYGGDKKYKNLCIMNDTDNGEYGEGENKITRLTQGDWIDTQCQWSPTGDWIVFSSTRNKPEDALESDHGLDPGYFAVYLVNANKPSVWLRVMGSGNDLAGHVNHPFFSPDGESIVVTSDLAGVSVDPISLPLFLHSARPYGDIFTFDINLKNIKRNKNLKFERVTHSRYENSTGTWTKFATHDPSAAWNNLLSK